MKDTEAVKDVLYRRLALTNGTVTSALTGGIYKDDRPDDSKVEDIVILCLPITSGQPQMATAMVNLHIPDMFTTIGTKQQYVTNHARIKVLSALIKPLIEIYSETDYNYHIDSINTFHEREKAETIMNFRVDFLIINK